MTSEGLLGAVLQNWTQASSEIVTNCDVGPGCGTVPLLYVAAGCLVAAVVIVALAGWRSDE